MPLPVRTLDDMDYETATRLAPVIHGRRDDFLFDFEWAAYRILAANGRADLAVWNPNNPRCLRQMVWVTELDNEQNRQQLRNLANPTRPNWFSAISKVTIQELAFCIIPK